MVGLYNSVPGLVRRAASAAAALEPSDGASMLGRAEQALRTVGRGGYWVDARVGDCHGIEQLTQLASVRVAGPDIIVLDEPRGASMSEVDHLARLLGQLKTRVSR